MKKALYLCLFAAFCVACSSKPTPKMAREAYEKHIKEAAETKKIPLQVKKFEVIGKPVTSVFELDCAKLPCYKVEFHSELVWTKNFGWYKKGQLRKEKGNIFFKKTENGWETFCEIDLSP